MLLLTGCDAGGPLEIDVEPDGGGGGTSGFDAGTEDASSGADADAATGTAVSPVLVGITPTPHAGAGDPTAGDTLEAQLTTFGAGVRAAVIVRPWATAPLVEDAALAKETAFYGAHDRRVLVSLAVVDRLVDQRPAALDGVPWDAPASLALMETTLDALFASSGDEVQFLTFGRDVDVYLDAHPDERPAFTTFVKKALAYARGHAGAATGLAVGVAFSPAAPKTEASFAELRDASDAIAFSYFPGLGTYESQPASDVVAMVAQLAELGASKPILLQAVGVASAETAGGSEGSQQELLGTLFGAVGAQRKSFALVNVVELHDARSATCSAWAEAQGELPAGPLAAYACSLGLFRQDGTAKPAWNAVLSGAASLSTP